MHSAMLQQGIAGELGLSESAAQHRPYLLPFWIVPRKVMICGKFLFGCAKPVIGQTNQIH